MDSLMSRKPFLVLFLQGSHPPAPPRNLSAYKGRKKEKKKEGGRGRKEGRYMGVDKDNLPLSFWFDNVILFLSFLL